MGTRRMFSNRVIGSARFLKMPISSQALYFHLGLNADDDGVVEAFKVIRAVGCSEDDLRVLASKNFIKVLNEDLVSYIMDWQENNYIRADRKIDSIYKDLLIEMMPDVQLIEKKPRSDIKHKAIETEAFEVIEEEDGQSMDSPRTENGRHKISKVKLSKDKLSKDKTSKDKEKNIKKRINYQEIVDFFNDTCVSFPRVTTLSESRKKAIRARLKNYTVDDIKKAFVKAEASSFLKGNNDLNWSANFDWMLKDANMAKILDGNYDNRQAKETPTYKPRGSAEELDDFYKMCQNWAGDDSNGLE